MNSILLIAHCSLVAAVAKSCPWICSCKTGGTLEVTNLTSYECVLNYNYSLSTLMQDLNPSLSRLTLKKSLLRSVESICRFPNLEYLDLSWNDFERILTYESYVICMKLKTLNLAHNHVKLLRRDEFASFPNLEYLDLSHNEIQEIREDTFRLPGLRFLDLSHNKLSAIPGRMFRYVSFLLNLDLSYNHFETLDFSSFVYLRSIQQLNVSNNQIRLVHSRAFEEIGPLRFLDISGNQLTEMPESHFLKHLIVLVADRNPIQIIEDVGLFPELLNLSISEMPELVMALSGSLCLLPRLTVLKMRANPKLTYISPEAFANDSVVRTLDFRSSNLRFIGSKILELPKLSRLLIAGNPIDMPCFSPYSRKLLQKSDISSRIRKSKGRCQIEMYPTEEDSSIEGRLGAPLRIYCCILTDTPDAAINWTVPNWDFRFRPTDEFLDIRYTSENDSGTYTCRALQGTKTLATRQISVSLEIPKVTIYVRKLAHYYVTIGWNSSTYNDRYGFYLKYRPASNPSGAWVNTLPLSQYPVSYSISRLTPLTNYTVCIVYQPQAETLYESCINVQTSDMVYSHIGMTLNYTLIALLSGIILTCCSFCTARCMYHRFHVWQREKLQSRMQESISAQGFFSSFDSLSSANVAVTYENPHRLEARDGSPEEAVRLVKHNAQLHSPPHPPALQNGASVTNRAPSAMTM